jgi:hypothetical protein
MLSRTPRPAGDGEARNAVPTVTVAQDDAPAGDGAPSEPARADHLDQIRDILFGRQKSETDARFGQLEQHLSQQVAALRADLTTRVDALDAFVRQEAESLARRLDAERRERTESAAELAESARSRDDALARRLDGVQENTDAESRALRQQVLDEAARAQASLRAQADALKAEIDAHVARLGDQKTDRQALAGLFSEVAARLSNGA